MSPLQIPKVHTAQCIIQRSGLCLLLLGIQAGWMLSWLVPAAGVPHACRFMVGNVGMPHNFFIIKFSMTILSLLLHGWTMLRMILDRYGLLWGPLREHKRGGCVS
jgi:hypothetical protein